MENIFKGTDKEWFAVNFGGYILIQDGPKYSDKSILDQEKVSEQVADANAQLMIHALPMLRRLESIVQAWESLPAGHNSVKQTQDWIVNTLHPEIVKTRKLIKSATEVNNV